VRDQLYTSTQSYRISIVAAAESVVECLQRMTAGCLLALIICCVGKYTKSCRQTKGLFINKRINYMLKDLLTSSAEFLVSVK